MITALSIPSAQVTMEADLVVPAQPAGVVLFAHGAGSSRHSPRNQLVAEHLHEHRFITVLADLLTEGEEAADAGTGALRFDIELLTERVTALIDWAQGSDQTLGHWIGLFGASTGAAAALAAAADRPEQVKAVVSRGGRPDLASHVLDRVRAPTMLIVGEQDPQVRALNETAAAALGAPNRMHVIPGATHLFEEEGALPQVAEHAVRWFHNYLR